MQKIISILKKIFSSQKEEVFTKDFKHILFYYDLHAGETITKQAIMTTGEICEMLETFDGVCTIRAVEGKAWIGWDYTFRMSEDPRLPYSKLEKLSSFLSSKSN